MNRRSTRLRTVVTALLASLLGVAGLALPGAGAVGVARAVDAPKVVIIVGATGSTTSTYRSYADAEAKTALLYTPNVVKVYSPNATWADVRDAVQGAAVVIYHGHGNGVPSPYPNSPPFMYKDGFGLNAADGQGDNNLVYYGEPWIRSLKLAPGALVLLHNLCYASGNSEPGLAQPTVDVARQRADNYASAFLAAGASAVIADGVGSASPYLTALFTTHQSIDAAWHSAPNFHNHVMTFGSGRTPGATERLDPTYPTSSFYRSITGNLGATTDRIVASAQFAGTVTRLGGDDRYATAAAISAASFKPGVPVAYVATGANFPDALAGAPVAGAVGGPILLVASDAIPAATATELARLKPASIVILGSSGVVSDTVASALGAYTN